MGTSGSFLPVRPTFPPAMRSIFLTACAALLAVAPSATAADLLPPDTPLERAIDHYVDAKLAEDKLTPAPLADDVTILRRTMLDLVGRVPTAIEAREYIANADPSKRQALVDGLIASPAFIKQQAQEFDTLLMHGTGGSLRDYLEKAFQEGRPWDRMFRDMLLGEEGDTEQKGAIKFVKQRANDLDRLTAETSIKFFGVNVSCAQCHDHPLVSDWKQDHYYGMKSFFARTFVNGDFIGEKEYGLVEYKTSKGESRQAKLLFLTGDPLTEPESKEPDDAAKKEEKKRLEELKKNKQPPAPPSYSRRAQLVETALKPDAPPYLSRALANQIWKRLYGRGLVDPVDQMHSENPPSHPELLDWLARDLREHGYDLKRLIRGLVLSNTYARSSRWESGDLPFASSFAVAAVRPLSPQQYAAVLKFGTTPPAQFASAKTPEERAQRIESTANAARSLAGLFEQPLEDFQVGVEEALLLSNADRIVKDLLPDGKGSLVAQLAETSDRNEATETLFWNVVCRAPTAEEKEAVLAFIERRQDRLTTAWQQALWALITSSECRFNH
jgi:hypothetical protein